MYMISGCWLMSGFFENGGSMAIRVDCGLTSFAVGRL